MAADHPKPELLRFLAQDGATTSTLAVVVSGRSLFFEITEMQLLTAIETAADSLKAMRK